MKIEIEKSEYPNIDNSKEYFFIVRFEDGTDHCKDIADVIDTISVRLNQEFKQ